ncbi:surface-adhesin E family protein [Dysgonomonas sp. 511]|uniref:surface-adhesin E family protein n=1 Tax=Dysgonomonas sp. 511 TaxID=2302930 RepID=UPI0013D676C2|nr:surface-adhesin E family protein [Dysgonomonas sp. 511]NDV77613.1 hypothetical protein [Dysgonomonas sp. 511]
MNKKYLYFIACSLILATGCKSVQTKSNAKNIAQWFNVAVTGSEEIYVDTANIRQEGAISYAREKRVYITSKGRKAYVNRIRYELAKINKAEKAEKWNDFSYCIYDCLYECTNKRFRILSVEDYDSSGKLITKTKPAKGIIKWLNVEPETVGDHTFFFVCDYNQ